MTLSSAPDRRATMPALVHATGNSRKVTALQSFGLRKKSEIDIILDGTDNFIPSYSTFDEIKGHADIRFEKDTLVDGLNIVFQGQTDSWVEKMAAVSPRAGRATAKHVFLRVQQPIEGNPFSQDNIARAGVTYSIPFKFVVPETMLPFVCNHTTNAGMVKSQHLFLPPSIGDEMLSGEGSVLMDDLCPAMAKIVYSIRVALIKSSINERPRDVVHESVRVRITPSRPELPPEIIPTCTDGRCQQYHLRKEKNVRRGIFKLGKKSGRLTAETSQPRSLRLPHAHQVPRVPASTTTTLNLRYDPTSMDEEPPQLSGVESKLKAYTFYGAQPFKQLPNPSNYDVWSVMHSQYSVTVGLSNMNLSSVLWKKHEPQANDAAHAHRGSVATSNSSIIEAMRTMSTSTGTESVDHKPNPRRFDRPASQVSNSSNGSYSAASSTTTLSSPMSPHITTSNQSFPDPTAISPSTTYDQSLPYYTSSIVVPITLPSIHKSDETTHPADRRSSNARTESSMSGDISPTLTTNSPAISQPVPISFGRRRNTPTFVPSFHSCLVSRVYVLDLTIHAANPAPQISLRTPIQISSDLPPGFSGSTSPTAIAYHQGPSLSAPLSWYDPSDIANLNQDPEASLPEKMPFGEDHDRDTANDEAIAHALSTQYNPNQQYDIGNDEIPSYAEIQTQTHDNSNYTYQQPQPQRRHNSFPLITSFPEYNHHFTARDRFNSTTTSQEDDDEQPPEYHATAGFRRRNPVVVVDTSVASSNSNGNGNHDTNTNPNNNAHRQTSSNNSAGQNPRRKASSSWGQKLRLRN